VLSTATCSTIVLVPVKKQFLLIAALDNRFFRGYSCCHLQHWQSNHTIIGYNAILVIATLNDVFVTFCMPKK
jgi:hypothetical protein